MKVHRPIISMETMPEHKGAGRGREGFAATLAKRHKYGTIELLIVWQLTPVLVRVRLELNHSSIIMDF
jgi:hypothetical protein